MLGEQNGTEMKNPHLGSDFDDFLEEEGILEECTAEALKSIEEIKAEPEKERRSQIAQKDN
ncbi:MAG: hypothetical protein V7731_16165 [Amphritea sp.]